MIEQIPLLAGLTSNALAAVTEAVKLKSVGRGTVLHSQGMPAHTVLYLMSGQIKQAICSVAGHEMVIELAFPGDMIGLAQVFSSGVLTSRTETLEASTIVEIGRDGLERAMELDVTLARRVVGALADHGASLVRDIASLKGDSSCKRALEFMQRCGRRIERDNGALSLDLPITKQLMAARIGLSPETLSRVFRDMIEGGLIEICGRQITLTARCRALMASPEWASIVPESPGEPLAPMQANG
ncbi:MAG: Crp/Fnr family transcriptional regulator [Rhodocyclaceae bacterium]|nr:Crp/Fnr family transcriptional regulator [Rhodocyclaceae bacterium]